MPTNLPHYQECLQKLKASSQLPQMSMQTLVGCHEGYVVEFIMATLNLDPRERSLDLAIKVLFSNYDNNIREYVTIIYILLFWVNIKQLNTYNINKSSVAK